MTNKRPGVARSRERGFTLIELMMVIVIVAILATIGYPSYINSVIKSNRAAAQSYLMDLAQAEQRYFNDARAYTTDYAGVLEIDVPERVDAVYAINIALVAGPPPGFTITATPRAGTRQADDGVLLIDGTGAKTRGGDPW